MNWLGENWIWLSMVILFVWMHTKMHGTHKHGRHDEDLTRAKNDPDGKERTHAAH